MKHRIHTGTLIALLGLILAQHAAPATAQALAATAPFNALEQRCWTEHQASRTKVDLREPTAVNFGNLHSGMVVRSPFWVDFGIRGMGVIPAGHPYPKAGHHHILIDTPLPLNYQDKIPFTKTHRHFGTGQTGALLDLPAGPHTLRLLFADHEHRPYFVFSKEITITVQGKRGEAPLRIDPEQFEATCTRWYDDAITQPRGSTPQVFIRNLRDGDVVSSPFMLGFGVIGFGVAPADAKVPKTGNFRLSIQPRSGEAITQKFDDGRTETLETLGKGAYTLTPKLLDDKGATLLVGQPVSIEVTQAER